MRYLTSGESHGKGLNVVIDGFPAGVRIDTKLINNELYRRQCGYGRGKRMSIEKDKIEIISGIRGGETLGSPITFFIKNRDWKNWKNFMDAVSGSTPGKEVYYPRPGHADLTGAIKYKRTDMRDILERASARETAARVAAGALCKNFLLNFNIKIYSHTVRIGKISINKKRADINKIIKIQNENDFRCIDSTKRKEMKELIDEVRKKGDTIGGQFEIIITGLPVGLGSHTQWDKKLDAILSYNLMSIQGIKAVEFGAGIEYGIKPGSKLHDEIYYKDKKFYRKTNNAGGIEGGMSNGEPVIIKCTMKPISTLMSPLNTVDVRTKKTVKAVKERSDVSVVPAASVIGENGAAFVISDEFMKKFGSDNLEEIKANYNNYKNNII